MPRRHSLDDGLAVVAERLVERRGQLVGRVGQRHPDAAAEPRRLDDRHGPDALADLAQHAVRLPLPRAAPEPRVVDDRQPVAAHEVLEDDLVHRHRARQHPGPGVRDARQLEEALQRAVLAEGTVDDEEGHVDRLRQRTHRRSRRQRPLAHRSRQAVLLVRPQPGHLFGGAGGPDEAGERLPILQSRRRALGQHPAPFAVDVHQVRLIAVAVDVPQHGLGRRNAHLVLGRPTTGEDPDPQPIAHCGNPGQSPTNSIS